MIMTPVEAVIEASLFKQGLLLLSLSAILLGFQRAGRGKTDGLAILSSGTVVVAIVLLNIHPFMTSVGFIGKLVIGLGLLLGILGVAKYPFPSPAS